MVRGTAFDKGQGQNVMVKTDKNRFYLLKFILHTFVIVAVFLLRYLLCSYNMPSLSELNLGRPYYLRNQYLERLVFH